MKENISKEEGTMYDEYEENSNNIKDSFVSLQSRRQKLNIPHFVALRNAFSNLARIDDFELEELGSGFFSDVFKVRHKQSGKVMVLKRNKNTNTKLNILRELQLMNRLSHPNVLKLMGACVDEGQMHALTEYINGGDLDELILHKETRLSWFTRVNIVIDIAQGMQYLHSTGVFHRDLSAKNCLIRVKDDLDDDGEVVYGAVVGDFGLAEKIPTCEVERSNLQIVGTPYVIAPEVLREKAYDQTADVFSFGILLCQLIARLPCDPEELPRTHDFGLNVELYKQILSSISDQPPVPEPLLQLAIDCCQVDASLRPSFTQCVLRLQHIRSDLKQTSFPSSLEACEDLGDSERVMGNVDDYAAATTTATPPTVVKRRKGGATKRASSQQRNSRLSMSFSDISWELINHAAANVANANSNQDHEEKEEQNDDDNITQSPFINPFAALEYLNKGRMDKKLVDAPSQTFLELTFNLYNNNKQNSGRPNSRYSLYGDETANNFCASPSSMYDVCGGGEGGRGVSERDGAVQRANLLSLGRGWHMWWKSGAVGGEGGARTPSHNDDDDDNNNNNRQQRDSLNKIVKALSERNSATMRRCISMPNLDRLQALFPQPFSTNNTNNNIIKTDEHDDVFTFEQLDNEDHGGGDSKLASPPTPPVSVVIEQHHQEEQQAGDANNNNSKVCSGCCCAVEVGPSPYHHHRPLHAAKSPAPPLFAPASPQPPSWTSCICGMGIPLIGFGGPT